jgi:hypothetical protein
MGVVFIFWTVEEPLYILIPASFIIFESYQHWKRQKSQDQKVGVVKNYANESLPGSADDEVDVIKSSGDNCENKSSTTHASKSLFLEDINQDAIGDIKPEKASFDITLISELAYDNTQLNNKMVHCFR